ncbi:MAB_1171c family putative transporter [Streptomyces sp. Ru73]|uniref:MAB_1171c family putative transporter n=1 Tax=Streptomyces sp. Ru73 TaxID=2080748 RepID=UPI0011B09472|nr:MAB_1171c family putative transporter [Streptomyces sp. Ru73]
MTVLILTAAILHLSVVWKLVQVARAPRDLSLRVVTLCLICTAASFLLGLDAAARIVDHVLGIGVSRLVQNALLLGVVYLLMCVFLVSAEERPRASRRARWEALPLAVAVLILILSTVATPADVRGRDFATADMSQTPVALFFIVAALYLVYALASALWWTVRYARMSLRPLATGLWLTTGALAGMVAANAGRLGIDVMRWRGEQAPAWLNQGTQGLLGLAVPVFIVGVTYSGAAMRLASGRVWLQHRRAYRRLRPLWDALHDAFPQDALGRVPTNGWRDFLSLRGTHYRYYRRVIECRDGLVRISPTLAQLGVQEDASPSDLARHLGKALDAQADQAATPGHALAVALPGDDENDLDADVRQLVLLSDALSRQPGRLKAGSTSR